MVIPEEIGRRSQRNDPPSGSGTEQGTRSSGTRPGQGCIKNPERTNVREEMSECNNGIRNRDLKERLRLRSERTSGSLFQEGSRAGGRERKSRTFTENECQDIVEVSAPSETKEDRHTE
jgi:hypothetical protein